MPSLEKEKSRLQDERQAAAAEVARLTAQRTAQEQRVVAAQGEVNAAKARVTEAQMQIPPLEAAEAAATRRVEEIDRQINAHAAEEPEPAIEVPNKPPRPNPAWRVWKRAMDALGQQRQQAVAGLEGARARLNEGRGAVSRAEAEVQAAERKMAEARAGVEAARLAIAAAIQRQDEIGKRLADLERINKEIARDPLNRKVLEQVAADLSERVALLEEAFAAARIENEDAEQNLASLIARRDPLTPALGAVNAQIPAAQTELQAAQAALSAAARRIETRLRKGPLA
jgi:chromosome segregation ATPase